jgi:RND family efflux transporter MFP subunit
MNRRVTGKWLALLLLSGCVPGCGPAQGPTAPPPPAVKASRPVTRAVTDYEDFPGRTEAVSSIDVRARVSGYLDKINFTEGETVQENDVLFEIDPRPYQAELERAEAALAQARAYSKRVDADLKSAEADVEVKTATLYRATRDWGRAEKLFPTGGVAQAEYDQHKAAFDSARANLDVSKASLEAARANVATARAQIGVAEANRKMAALNLGFTKVTAPISGVAGRHFRDPGNLVKADDTVLTNLVSRGPMYAYFDLDERTALRVKQLLRAGKMTWSQGQGLPVLMGLSDESGFPRQGVIDFRDNRVDADTGTWRLRARFDNADDTLTPGLFVRVRLPLGPPSQGLLIAEKALSTDQGQKFVYVLRGDNTVEARRVKVGRLHDGLRVITDGLRADERVLVSGLQRVREGVTVTAEVVEMPGAAPAAAAQAGTPPGQGTEAKKEAAGDGRRS